jgi:hypothetical protein
VYLAIGGLAILVAGYRISLWIHPFRRCWRCTGTGKHRGLIMIGTFRLCRVCGGNGRRRRFGGRRPSVDAG